MGNDFLNLIKEKDTPKNATAIQNEPTSTKATIAPRPRREAIRVTIPLKSTALYGVLYFRCDLPNTGEIILPRPMAKSTRDPAKKKPFQLVSKPMRIATRIPSTIS